MTRAAFCRKSLRVPRVCWLGSWALGTSDRETTTTTAGRQDKSPDLRLGHVVGWIESFGHWGRGTRWRLFRKVQRIQRIERHRSPSYGCRRP